MYVPTGGRVRKRRTHIHEMSAFTSTTTYSITVILIVNYDIWLISRIQVVDEDTEIPTFYKCISTWQKKGDYVIHYCMTVVYVY